MRTRDLDCVPEILESLDLSGRSSRLAMGAVGANAPDLPSSSRGIVLVVPDTHIFRQAEIDHLEAMRLDLIIAMSHRRVIGSELAVVAAPSGASSSREEGHIVRIDRDAKSNVIDRDETVGRNDLATLLAAWSA